MTWVVILAVGVGSFVFRLAPLLVLQRMPLSDFGDRLIRHAGTAAITALIAVSANHSAAGAHAVPALIAVGAAVLLAARGASMLRLLACGGGIYTCAVIVIDLLTR